MSDGVRLTMLISRDAVMGYEVLRRGGGIHISSDADIIPVYAIKMDEGLMTLLKKYKHVWMEDGEKNT